MNEIKVTGKQNFMGIEIPVVAGGFGDGKRCVCDKTVGEIHGMKTFHIRENIIKNISRFKENVEYIDLKNVIGGADNNLLMDLGYSKMEISKSEHIYLLSERGYSKLIKIMDTDLAWDTYDKLLDEYFTLREQRPNWSLGDQIKIVAQGYVELEKRVEDYHQEFKDDLKDLKETLPLLGVDMQELTYAIHKVGVDLIGGKNSAAYKNKGLRSKVYTDIHSELKRQYDVRTYKAIPRGKLAEAISIVNEYRLPLYLKDAVEMENNQVRIEF